MSDMLSSKKGKSRSTSISSIRSSLKNKKKSKSIPSSSSSSTSRKAVSHSNLGWQATQLPSQVLDKGGYTEHDFFHGLDQDDDDFMGLKEVEGVEVGYEDEGFGGKRIVFKVMDKDTQVARNQDSNDLEEQEKKKKDKGKKRKIDLEQLDLETEKQEESVISQPKKSKKAKKSEKKVDGKDQKVQSKEDEDEGEEERSKDPDEDLLKDAFDQSRWQSLQDQLEESFDESSLPNWSSIPLSSILKSGLYKSSFHTPTSIQSSTLPHSLTFSRDVVGIAQTGSGKTLAYGLPILEKVLELKREELNGDSTSRLEDDEEDGLIALILTPTRELAIQVSKSLSDLIAVSSGLDPSSTSASISKKQNQDFKGQGEKKLPFAQIVTLTGGLSIQKQQRLLSRGKGPEIVVATPGRLWEIMKEDDDFSRKVKRIRFLVVDEADRMIEVGHFREMEGIFRMIKRDDDESQDQDQEEVEDWNGISNLDEDEDEDEIERPNAALNEGRKISTSITGSDKPRDDMQTFIFSATLSKNLQINLKRSNRKKKKIGRKGGGGKEESTLEELMLKIDFRDQDPVVVDLSPENGLAENVGEAKVECLAEEKDLYLYYFLLRYPGRTLVFLNSIDGIRRLTPLLSNLDLKIQPLHSQLQQKQRLKGLDRFRSQSEVIDSQDVLDEKINSKSSGNNVVLLATDVAARGLDIKGVDHVIHYQLPRSIDNYVHRSGRTGRAGKTGLAVSLIEPKEKRLWKELRKGLGREDDVAILPVEYSFLPSLRARLTLSRQIDNASHSLQKASHDESWLRNLAKEAELEIDDEEDSGDEDEDFYSKDQGKVGQSKENKRKKLKVEGLKRELKELLKVKLSARGVSHKYLTGGSIGFVDGLLNDQNHETMIGVKSSTAKSDLAAKASKKPKKKEVESIVKDEDMDLEDDSNEINKSSKPKSKFKLENAGLKKYRKQKQKKVELEKERRSRS